MATCDQGGCRPHDHDIKTSIIEWGGGHKKMKPGGGPTRDAAPDIVRAKSCHLAACSDDGASCI